MAAASDWTAESIEAEFLEAEFLDAGFFDAEGGHSNAATSVVGASTCGTLG
jgi:hypothetical protein